MKTHTTSRGSVFAVDDEGKATLTMKGNATYFLGSANGLNTTMWNPRKSGNAVRAYNSAGEYAGVVRLEQADAEWLYEAWPIAETTYDKWMKLKPASVVVHEEWERKFDASRDDFTRLMETGESRFDRAFAEQEPELDEYGKAWKTVERFRASGKEYAREAVEAIVAGNKTIYEAADEVENESKEEIMRLSFGL